MSFHTTRNLYYIRKANMGTIWGSWNSYNRSWAHWELFGTLNVLECDKTILFYTKVYLDVIESFYFTKFKVSQSGEKEKGKKRPLCGFVMTLHPELRAIIFSLRVKERWSLAEVSTSHAEWEHLPVMSEPSLGDEWVHSSS